MGDRSGEHSGHQLAPFSGGSFSADVQIKTMATTLRSLRTPCAVVLQTVVKQNCTTMLARADKLGVTLRPHVKTHKTIEGALLQTGGRPSGITVSTIAEAEFFTKGGFDDVLYAVPITPDKLEHVGKLVADQANRVHVCVDHHAQLDALIERAGSISNEQWSVAIMVDCGYHRDGVDPESSLAIELATKAIAADRVDLFGVYTHGGHSYDADDIAGVHAVGEAERDATVRLADRIQTELGVEVACVGVGSTPTASNPPPTGFEGVNELHPGNYIFYDWIQHHYSSCATLDDVGIRVLTRVVGHYEASNTLLIDMGWTGCSKQGAEVHYGALWRLGESGVDAGGVLQIQNLKQEAGEVSTIDGSPVDFSQYPVGSFLQLIPFHSCAAAHQHHSLHVVDGGSETLSDESVVVNEWVRCRGW